MSRRKGNQNGGRNRARRESRTIPIKGNGNDDGKYYRCWNCGFHCDVERDSLGGSEEREKLTYLDAVIPSQGATGDGDSLSAVAVLGDYHASVAMELDSKGNPKVHKHFFTPNFSKGCPFCGTLNWRGDY